jgi:hypothetical protein
MRVFTCHAVSDGHPFNGKTIGWAVAGHGRVFVAPFLSQAREEAARNFPGEELSFRESFGVEDVQTELVDRLRGINGYLSITWETT